MRRGAYGARCHTPACWLAASDFGPVLQNLACQWTQLGLASWLVREGGIHYRLAGVGATREGRMPPGLLGSVGLAARESNPRTRYSDLLNGAPDAIGMTAQSPVRRRLGRTLGDWVQTPACWPKRSIR